MQMTAPNGSPLKCNSEVYNGDLGIIARIDLDEAELAIDFEGREVVYAAS